MRSLLRAVINDVSKKKKGRTRRNLYTCKLLQLRHTVNLAYENLKNQYTMCWSFSVLFVHGSTKDPPHRRTHQPRHNALSSDAFSQACAILSGDFTVSQSHNNYKQDACSYLNHVETNQMHHFIIDLKWGTCN